MFIIFPLQAHPSARPWVALSLPEPFPFIGFVAHSCSFKGCPKQLKPTDVSRCLLLWGTTAKLIKHPKRHGKIEPNMLKSRKKEEQINGNQKKILIISFQVNSSAINPRFIPHAIVFMIWPRRWNLIWIKLAEFYFSHWITFICLLIFMSPFTAIYVNLSINSGFIMTTVLQGGKLL